MTKPPLPSQKSSPKVTALLRRDPGFATEPDIVPVAIKAFRDGTLPFPDGAMIAAAHWNEDSSDADGKVLAAGFPGANLHATFAGAAVNVQSMVKDSKNMPHPAKTLAGAIKARWICEQAHQQLKEELGLDHFEGRSWPGLHRHALMTKIAYAFLQQRRLAAAGREKKSRRTTATAELARSASHHHRSHDTLIAPAMPALPKMAQLGVGA